MVKKFDLTYGKLLEVSDDENAVAMSKYMRNRFAFLGVKTPLRRDQMKSLINEWKKEQAIDWEFIFECYQSEFRECHYVAFDYLQLMSQYLTLSDRDYLTYLATHQQWWDTIDRIDRIIGNISFNDPVLDQWMLDWSQHEDFWLRRIAIDHQIGRKTNTNQALLSRIIENNFGSDEFFINKAIGWSLREYAKTNPVWVKTFVESHHNKMSNLSIREALKHLKP